MTTGVRRALLATFIAWTAFAYCFSSPDRPVFNYVSAHDHHAAAATFVDNRTWDISRTTRAL